MIHDNYILGSSLIYNRSSAEGLRYDEKLRYVSDHKFFVDLARHHDYFYIKEPLAQYRIHPKNTISSDRKGLGIDVTAINEYFLKAYGKELPRAIQGALYFNLVKAHFATGDKKSAKYFLIKAIKCNYIQFQIKSAFAHPKNSLIIIQQLCLLIRNSRLKI